MIAKIILYIIIFVGIGANMISYILGGNQKWGE